MSAGDLTAELLWCASFPWSPLGLARLPTDLTCSPAQVFAGGCNPANGAEDQAWRYGYDAMGHRVSQVPPVNQTATALSSRSWTYDAGGRLTSICDFAAGGSCATASRHTDLTYDALARELTRTVYQGAGTGTPKLSWTNTWNEDGTQASVAFDGTASGEGTDSLTFTYDGLGRPDQVKRSSTVLTDYGWNADGTLATRVDGTLGTSTFSYDWADRLATMTSPLWTGSLTWSYRLDGLLAARQWPAGSSGQATYAYDGAKRPITFTKVGSAAATFSQAYDRDGNVVSEGRTLAGVPGDAGNYAQAFAYDGLHRVTGSSGLTTTYTYTYDRDGNRLSADASGVTTTYAYDRTGVLLSRFDDPTTTYFTYDVYGNLTSHASAVNANTTLTYDLADRLLTTVLPGPGNTTTAFTLDALGRIATRTPPGGSAEPFSYLGTSETVTAIGGVTPVSAGLDPAGARLAAQSGATTGFLLADLHANLAAATTSGETALLAAVRYDPYGGTAASWDSGAGFPMPWRFQSRLDLMSNPTDPLYEWSARYYLPAVGAFSQLDAYAGQVGDPRSLHRYLYAAANPWTLIDPSGHAFISGPEAEDSQKAVYTSDGQLHWIDRGPGPAPGQTTPSSLSTPPLSAKVRNPKSEPDPILFVGSTVLNLARLFGSDVACLSTYLTPISAIGCDDIMALAGREDSGIDPLNFIYENHGPLVGDDPVAKGEAFANVLYVASLGAGGVSLLRGLARVRFLQPNQVLDPIGEALGPRPPGPYQRPPGATTAAQRDAVQGQPCVVCGVTTPRQVADHTYALVREWYETGTIDLQRARSVEAVQAMCPGCSAAEGGFLSWYSRAMKDIFGFD